jgi:hypothetical protein
MDNWAPTSIICDTISNKIEETNDEINVITNLLKAKLQFIIFNYSKINLKDKEDMDIEPFLQNFIKKTKKYIDDFENDLKLKLKDVYNYKNVREIENFIYELQKSMAPKRDVILQKIKNINQIIGIFNLNEKPKRESNRHIMQQNATEYFKSMEQLYPQPSDNIINKNDKSEEFTPPVDMESIKRQYFGDLPVSLLETSKTNKNYTSFNCVIKPTPGNSGDYSPFNCVIKPTSGNSGDYSPFNCVIKPTSGNSGIYSSDAPSQESQQSQRSVIQELEKLDLNELQNEINKLKNEVNVPLNINQNEKVNSLPDEYDKYLYLFEHENDKIIKHIETKRQKMN